MVVWSGYWSGVLRCAMLCGVVSDCVEWLLGRSGEVCGVCNGVVLGVKRCVSGVIYGAEICVVVVWYVEWCNVCSGVKSGVVSGLMWYVV